MSVDGAEVKKKNTEKENSTFLQIREILESLAVALFLAFLFKTFEAEAFVIPTGSMAPTLMGRHKDVNCSQCGYNFQVSASEEMNSATNTRSGLRVVAGVCPQCGFTEYFGDEIPSLKTDKKAPSFTGDRILVSKMTFDQRDLARWDVSVFRAPNDPKVNFIKRFVGLPNENLRIQYGDIFVQKLTSELEETKSSDTTTGAAVSDSLSPDVDLSRANVSSGTGPSYETVDSSKPFEIARKEYKYLRQILQVVYDEDYKAEKLQTAGWPERWTDDLAYNRSDKVAWTSYEREGARGFKFDGALSNNQHVSSLQLGSEADVAPIIPEDADFYWLRYRHIVPSSRDWIHLSEGRLPLDVERSGKIESNPRLIDDFSAYNAGISRRQASREVIAKGGRATSLVEEWDRSRSDEFSALSQTFVGADGVERTYCFKNPDGFGCNWVGDLAFSCDLTINQANADSDKIAFDLVKGGVVFRCVIMPKAGTITLSVPSVPEFKPSVLEYRFVSGKTYHFAFLNVDEEMRVAVDDAELIFPDGGGRYDRLTQGADALIPRNRDPNARDLAPVAIGAHGVSVSIEHMKVLRDVYYIAAGRMLEEWDAFAYNDFGTARCDRLISGIPLTLNEEDDASRFMSTPKFWRGYGNTKSALFTLREGQYLGLGDNSGFSLDSRLWADNNVSYYIDRKFLIGKAFYVYWPHGWPLPVIKSPFWPNFAKMRHVE